jgi:dTMP kinase
MNTSTNGALIIIEGADGVGTTTQAQMLFDWLLLEFPQTKPILTAEPTRGAVGLFIRSILNKGTKVGITSRGMASLFFADRTEHFTQKINPALDSGHWVICDRNWQSTLVYQGLTQNPLNLPWIMNLHTGLLPQERYCYVLDVPQEATSQRRSKRGGVEQMYETESFQACVLRAYKEVPQWDWTAEVISCGSASVANVHEMLQERVLRVIKSKYLL